MQDPNFKKTPLAAGIAVALGATAPSMAQEEVMEEVVTVGIRGSLQSSMIQKRDAQGVSDGIIAEDIGKFPDTNLAESMQRITGVSIDRTAIGEGSRVTVRGVGPDFNLVTLNGRQMPGTTIEATSSSDSRSFDFANLASEAVAGVQVYKTSLARLPTGGMGATINIKTARPLDAPDGIANVGAKLVFDDSVVNGDSATPEISGIFSHASIDGRWGVGITASYQDRNLGYNQASVASGFRTNFGDNSGWGSLPDEGSNGTTTENRPDGLYLVPQNIAYTFNDIQRVRTNGQLTLQFAPTDTLTATVDYTYAENEILQQTAELSAWNGFSSTVISSWTDGPVASPITYTQVQDPNDPDNPDATGDFGGNHGEFGVVHELTSIGFNLEWDPTDQLSFAFDFHDSESDSGKASPYGTNNAMGFFGFYRGTTTYDFTNEFPGLAIDFGPGVNGPDPSQTYTTGSSFRNAVSTNSVSQAQLNGSYFFENDAYSLDFGVMYTEVENRSAYANVQADTWGGVGSPADYDDSLFEIDDVSRYFSGVPGAGNDNIVDQFIRLSSFREANDAARSAVGGDRWGPSDDFQVDRRTTEETSAAYLQLNSSFDLGAFPTNVSLGVRYEETEVTSSALVPTATRINWAAANEFPVEKIGEDFTTLTGKYDYTLPSLDVNLEITEDVILRFGYSETIGRPGWGDIQGGQTIDDSIRLVGGNGNQGNPGLLPLESTNFDVSFEWYYGDGSYFSLSWFNKDIDNYISTVTTVGTPFELPHPGQGPRYAEADAATGGIGDPIAIRQYIFENYADTPFVEIFVDEFGDPILDTAGNFTGNIYGIPGEDPSALFTIFEPANTGEEGVDGWELAIQHMFGETGFGFNINYTIVNADNEYDKLLVDPTNNNGVVQQFVLEGISDSANVILFFENETWSTRLAYNWRDRYLAGRFDGAGQPNPVYVDPYGQLDANISYTFNDDLSFVLEGINITDEYTRSYIRNRDATGWLTTTGPRFMIGARYNFR